MKSTKVSGGQGDKVGIVGFAARALPTPLRQRNPFCATRLCDFHIVGKIAASIQEFADSNCGLAHASSVVTIARWRNRERLHRRAPIPLYFRESRIAGWQ